MLTSACGFHDDEDGDNDGDDADGGQGGNCAVGEGDDEKTREKEGNDFDGGDYQHSPKRMRMIVMTPNECFLL